jgi:hypothetical protein
MAKSEILAKCHDLQESLSATTGAMVQSPSASILEIVSAIAVCWAQMERY